MINKKNKTSFIKDKKIIEEVVKQSGYVMEQRIANTLESLKWKVSQSYNFKDPDEQKSRELDIIASNKKQLRDFDITFPNNIRPIANTELLIECKGEESPLIVFPKISKFIEPVDELIFAGDNWISNIDKSFLHYKNTNAIGCQACGIYEKKDNAKEDKDKPDNPGNYYANNSTFYDAIETLIKALLSYRGKFYIHSTDEKSFNVAIIHPVLVWRSGLYKYDYKKNIIEDTDFIPIYHSHRSETTKGDFIIYAVQEKSLNNFVAEMEKELTGFVDSLEMLLDN